MPESNRKVSAPSSHRAHRGGLRQVTGMPSDGQGLAPWRGSRTQRHGINTAESGMGGTASRSPPSSEGPHRPTACNNENHHHNHWASYSGNFTQVKFNRSRYRSRLEHRFLNLLNGPDCSPRFLSIHCIPHSHNCTTAQGQQRVYYKNHGREGLSLALLKNNSSNSNKQPSPNEIEASKQIPRTKLIKCGFLCLHTTRVTGQHVLTAAYSRPQSLLFFKYCTAFSLPF